MTPPAAATAPVWSPDTHPVYRIIRLTDVLVEAYMRYAEGSEDTLRRHQRQASERGRPVTLPTEFFNVCDRVPPGHAFHTWHLFWLPDCRAAWDAVQAVFGSDPADRGAVYRFVRSNAEAYLRAKLGARDFWGESHAADGVFEQFLKPEADVVGDPCVGGRPARVAEHWLNARGELVRLLAEADGAVPPELARSRIRAADLVAELPAPWRPGSATAAAPPAPQPTEVACPEPARSTHQRGGGRKRKSLSPGVAEVVRRWLDPHRCPDTYPDVQSVVDAVREDVPGAAGTRPADCRRAILAEQRRRQRRQASGRVGGVRDDWAA